MGLIPYRRPATQSSCTRPISRFCPRRAPRTVMTNCCCWNALKTLLLQSSWPVVASEARRSMRCSRTWF